jgi:dihydroxyacetone kinase-like predicted kinase
MRTMSIAKRTALDVLENTGKGKKVSVKALAIKNGASLGYAHSGDIQKNKEYQDVMNTALDKMTKIRERSLDALLDKDMSKERYQTLVQGVSTLTHDTQLLSGGKTENVSVEEDRRILIGIVNALRLGDSDTH